jgi:gentisate 1,2-dioxygenase
VDWNDAARDLKREWVVVVSWHAQRTTPSSKDACMFSFPTL